MFISIWLSGALLKEYSSEGGALSRNIPRITGKKKPKDRTNPWADEG